MSNEEQPNSSNRQDDQHDLAAREQQFPPIHQSGKALPLPAQYQEPIVDMGTSLGYGQGMEYQYFETPQPSQPLPVLRKIRLQRLPPTQNTGALQRGNIRRATLILTGAFIASRVLGVLRSSMFTFFFGTQPAAAAYSQAFAIPNTIFNIVAGGALSSAFIPVFTQYMVSKKDEKTAWHIASTALNLALTIMIILALLAMLFANQIVSLYTPRGAHELPGQYNDYINLIVALARIMLLQAIVLGGGVIVNAVLNARQHFLLPAIGTVLYNVGLIIGLLPALFLYIYYHYSIPMGMLPIAIDASAWGVVLGAVLQVAVQIPGLSKVQMRYRPTFDWRHPGIIQIGRQMIPRIINAAMLSLATFVDLYLINSLNVRFTRPELDALIAQYNPALQLIMLPIGIFGMSVSTAAFPTLAENIARGRLDRVRNIILETLRSILFLSIPSSVGIFIVGFTIIQALFEHGNFHLEDAQATMFPLAGFTVGLVGLAAVEILTRAFYALRDSRTPVIVSVSQFIIKIALSVMLLNVVVLGSHLDSPWGTGILAFSTALAGSLEAIVLFWLLHRRLGNLLQRELAAFIGRVLIASAVMGIVLLITRFVLDYFLVTTVAQLNEPQETLFPAVKLTIELFVGTFVYIRIARRLGIEELGPVKRLLGRFKLSWI